MRILSRLLALIVVVFVIYACAAGGGGDTPGGGGGSSGDSCGQGTVACGTSCTNLSTDRSNCGNCGNRCGDSQTCSNGQCSCITGLSACGSACVNLASDGNNCGMCNKSCGGQFCSQGQCSSTCRTGETQCGNSCVNINTDPLNCGGCAKPCAGGSACNNGACACSGGQQNCGGQCIDVSSNAQNCGSCGHACTAGQTCSSGVCTGGGSVTGTGGAGGGTGAGTGGGTVAGTGGTAGARDSGTQGGGLGDAAPPPTSRGACPATPGLIADFEEGLGSPAVIVQEGRSGGWEKFNDGAAAGAETVAVEAAASGGTTNTACDKFALHVTGRGWASFAGFGLSLANPPNMPMIYNATSHNFTGVRFRAKIGTGHDAKAAVRFNISTPWTEGSANPGGTCVEPTGTVNPEKAALHCFLHPGKFQSVIPADNELSTTWKTFSYCFDRDLYPQALPSNMTNDQRNTVAANMLKIQFVFNKGKDYTTPVPTNGMPYAPPVSPATAAFDYWVDQLEFFTGACPTTANFQSNGSPTAAFPQNTAIGTCATAANAANFNTAISKAYATWKAHFVQGSQVVAPEQSNITTSEAMGYGMMIAAAMGDKTTFDGFSSYVQAHLDGSGLMNWNSQGGANSATDADGDIIYAYLMANKQWPTGGYMGRATPMITAFQGGNVSGGNLKAGDQFPNSSTNASYFSPYAYRVFGGLAAVITSGYNFVNANVSAGTAGLPTDWSDVNGNPIPANASGAAVVNLISTTLPVFGYDAARVPWRLGMDKCLNASANTMAITSIVNFFAAKYGMGAQIDLLKAGWFKGTGAVAPAAADMQGSYIGPMGIAGMALGGTVGTAMRDRSFRTLLDILENGDFNHTYFPSTVGLITALIMSGNFPTP